MRNPLKVVAPVIGFALALACGGGATDPAAPSIARFAADSQSITAGDWIKLRGVIANGNGDVAPGRLAVTSGSQVNVRPKVTTVYTLRVTDGAGHEVDQTVTINVVPCPCGEGS
jgi:hypothetical protein